MYAKRGKPMPEGWTLDGYLAEGRTMFVVSCWEEPGENYRLVAEQAGVFDLNDRRVYRLYRRMEDKP